MKKISLVIVLCMVIQLFAVQGFAATDYVIGTDGSVTYKLVYDASLNGNTLQVDYNGTVEWTSINGSIGLRTVNTSDSVSQWNYVAYSSVTSVTGGYVASGNISSTNGSVIAVSDTYKVLDGGLEIRRSISVTTANANDKGFQISMPVRSAATIDPKSLEWFTPSSWYGNDSDNFNSRSKMAFDGIEASSAADNLGIPMIFNYNTTSGRGLNVTDITGGLKETINADAHPETGKILVDKRINVPGVGMRKVSNTTEVFHTFPGHTYNYRNMYGGKPVLYRFTPVTQGITKSTAVRITYKPYANFNNAFRDAWRDNYDDIAVLDTRIDTREHFDTLVKYMDTSYGYVNGRYQYCTNYGHFVPESGLLWRNTEIGWIMLAQGWAKNNSTYKDHARNVINDQVNVGGIFNSGRKGGEGHLGLIRAYNVDKANNVTNATWYSKCVSYANGLPQTPDYYQIPFLVEMYNVTQNNTYLDKAKRAGDAAWTGGHSTLRFMGSLEDYAGGSPEHDREAGYLALEAYMALYNTTNDTKWLDRAKVAADYSETWLMVQNLKMTTEDSPFNARMFGNDIPPYGLSGVHAGSNSGDQYQAINSLEYYQLYLATNDSHYLDFTKYIEHNSMLYTNLGENQGYMADWVKNTGYGFTNEFLGAGANTYWTNSRRGDGHDSNLGWTSYVLLAMTQRTLDYTNNTKYKFSNEVIVPVTRPELTPYSEDYDDGNADGWTNYEGTWSVSNGQYTVGAHPGAKSIVESSIHYDFTYEADISVGSSGDAGLVFRNNGSGNGADNFAGYYLGINAGSDKIVLGKANSEWKDIESKSVTIDADTFYHVKIEAVGPNIKVYFNKAKTPIINVTDYSWVKGNIGLRTYYGEAKFDDISISAVTPTSAFSDDFDDGDTTNWTPYGGTWSEGSSKYSVSAGTGGMKSVANSTNYSDCTLEADVAIKTDNIQSDGGIIFRVSDPADGTDSYKGYYAGLSANGNKVILGKSNNSWSEIQSVTMTIDKDTEYTLKVEAIGSSIKVYVDDVLKITATDTTWTSGQIGLRSYKAAVDYNGIIVTE